MRSSLLYLLLVGAPLLGLLAILTAGEQLVAPHAIGGAWTLQAASGSSCILTVEADATAEMNISQSGPRGEATFAETPGTTLSILLDGDSVTGAGPAPAADGCSGKTLALNGTLRMTDSTTVISGTLSRVGCATCNLMVFNATRSYPAER